MYYTCKRCSTLLKEKKSCHACGKTDQVMEIIINVHGNSKKYVL